MVPRSVLFICEAPGWSRMWSMVVRLRRSINLSQKVRPAPFHKVRPAPCQMVHLGPAQGPSCSRSSGPSWSPSDGPPWSSLRRFILAPREKVHLGPFQIHHGLLPGWPLVRSACHLDPHPVSASSPRPPLMPEPFTSHYFVCPVTRQLRLTAGLLPGTQRHGPKLL